MERIIFTAIIAILTGIIAGHPYQLIGAICAGLALTIGVITEILKAKWENPAK